MAIQNFLKIKCNKGHKFEAIEYDCGVMPVFEDEYYTCSECGKAVCTNTYGWPNYISSEYGLICRECVEDEGIEELIELYQNEKKAIPSWAMGLVEKEGFHCPDTYCSQYESGLHVGMNDTPEKTLENLEKYISLDEYDYLFVITDSNMFSVSWTILIRKKEEV